jgi:hypothetical protein
MPVIKNIILVGSFLLFAISFISCGNAETKADVSDTLKTNSENNVVAPDKPAESAPAGPTSRSISPGGDKTSILQHIDTYLVSKLAYPDPETITVENKLPDIMIQKAIAEVIFKGRNGEVIKTDFYILENIEPGGSKSSRIAAGPAGATASAHILKLKSDDLTDGELIMVGSKYSPK